LPALDVNNYSVLTEVIQLTVENGVLDVAVTNKEYYVNAKIAIPGAPSFRAAVKAAIFIKLIENITTETIDLSIKDNNLIIKGNGNYKLPLIYDNDKIIELPKIEIQNVTNKFTISGEILRSINTYNSKELLKGTILKPVQNMYYIDENGAITFTSGACINNFKLSQPVSLLLNTKLVKLFNLFPSDATVNFELGVDVIAKNVEQTKVKFYTDTVFITAILANDAAMMKSFPVNAIRNRLNSDYKYSITIDKNYLIQAIDRLSIFISNIKESPYILFDVHPDKVILSDIKHENTEEIGFMNELKGLDDKYSMVLDLNDFKLTLSNYTYQDVTIRFGDKQAILIPNGNINIILPEILEG
jgi:hypothetical protein